MSRSERNRLTVLIVLFLFAASAAAQDPAAKASDYSVQLLRKEKAGERHRIHTTVRVEQALEVLPEEKGSQSVDAGSESIRFELEAVAETLAVDARGLATRRSFRVETLTVTNEEGTREILGRGTVVLTRLEKEETVFEIEGKGVPEDVSAALGTLGLELDTDGDDDRIFGTPARQRIGSSWPIRTATFVAGFKDLKIDPSELRGATTLVGERTVHGIPCLELKLDVEAGHVTFPGEGDESPSTGTLRLEATGFFPLDPALQPLGGTRKMERLVTLLNPEGNKLNLRLTIHEETSVTPLAARP